MSSSEVIQIGGIEVQVNRKPIKNLHLSVLPPYGRVRMSVPMGASEQAVRLAVINKLAWIKKQQADFEAQRRQSIREMVSGESHYLWGKQHRLDIVKTSGKHKVSIKGNSIIELQVADNTTADNRLKLLNGLYRQQVQKTITKLLPYW